MSGAFPTTPVPARVELTSFAPTLVSVSHSLNRQVRSRGGQRWRLTMQYPPLTRDELAPLFAFAVAQRGQFETFTFVPPDLATPRGAATGVPVVDGAGQTGRTLAIRGATASVTGWLRAGDVIKLASGPKVYMVTADADTDASGKATLSIEPALMSSPADGEAVMVRDVPFTVAFAGDSQTYTVEPGLIYGYQIDLVEVA